MLNNSNDDNYSSVFTNEVSNINELYLLKNTHSRIWKGYDIGLNYQLGFKRNKNQSLTVSYKFNSNNNDQLNQIRISEKVNYFRNDYNQKNNSGVDEQTIQLDYTHPLKKIDSEGGTKAILRNNYSNYEEQGYDLLSNSFLINSVNDFKYQQNVYSLYNSYLIKFNKYTVRGGMRLERTIVAANFISKNISFSKDYNNFIPTISIQRKFNKVRSLNFGYTQRIQRPGISQLNPFIDETDPKFTKTGNIDLKPVLNHSFSINFSSFQKKTFEYWIELFFC